MSAVYVRPRRSATLRWRLTALYGGLFLVAAAAVLAITYLMVASRLPKPPRFPAGARASALPDIAPRLTDLVATIRAQRSALAQQRGNALHEMLIQSGIAFGVVAVLAIGIGWLVAGRALRPLREVTAAAQRLSTHNLDERINLRAADGELKDLADTFDAMLARLSSAFDAQRRFVANASHELRTPITVQRAAIDVALDDPEPTVESLTTMAGRVRDATQRHEHLIDSLLALARGQAGIEHVEDVDLAAAARMALAAASPDSPRVDERMHPARVRGDRALLERLAANLVDNAVRHNVVGGWITVGTWADHGNAVLRVANSGPKLAPDHVDELFLPFRRLRRDAGHARDGHGLGLSIVAAIVTAHRGSCTARALPGGGLDVCVVLPPG